MTTTALQNLWNYISSLDLNKDNRDWLAGRIIEFNKQADDLERTKESVSSDSKKMRILRKYEYLPEDQVTTWVKENPVQLSQQSIDDERTQYILGK